MDIPHQTSPPGILNVDDPIS